MSADIPDVSLRVLFDFEYQTKDGREISIHHGEKLFLLRKTNADWWQVIRNSSERPFYVPATYVTEKTDAFDKKMREERKAWVVDEIISDIPSRNKQEDSSYINVWKENRKTYELKDSKISSYLSKQTLSRDKSEISQRSQSRENYEEINTSSRRRRLVNGLSSSFDSDDSRSIDFVDVRTTVRQLSASPVNEEGTRTTTPVSAVDSGRLCAPVQTLKSSSSDTALCLNNTTSPQGLPHTTTKPVCDDCFTKYHRSSNESIYDDCEIQPRPLSSARYTAVKSKQLLDSSTENLDVKQPPAPRYRSNPRNAKLVHESSTDSVISDDYLLQRNTKLISTPKPRLLSSESSDADILDDHIYRRYPSNVHKLRTSYEKSIEQSLDNPKYEIDSTELRNIRLNTSASDSIICRTRLLREPQQQAPQRPKHLDIESCLYDNYRPRSKSAIAAELRSQPTRTKQLNAWLAQATSKQRSFNIERLIDVPTKNLRSGKSPSDFIRSNTWHTDFVEPLKPKPIPKINGQVLFSSSLDVKPRIERTPSPRLGVKSLASPRIGIRRQSKVQQDSLELAEQPQTQQHLQQQQLYQHQQKQEVQISNQSRQYRRSPHTIDRGEGNYIGPPSTFLSNNAHKLKVQSRSLESINTGLHKRPMKRTISKSRDTSPRNINKISSLIDPRVLRTQENATISIINQSGIRITNTTDKPQRSESSSDSNKHRNLNIEQKSKSSRESSRSASPRHLQPSRSGKNLNVRRESKESSASSRRSSPINRSQSRKELTPSPSNLQTPLSASLEKLAQQIKFSPNITAQERIMMSKIADKLQHSCSFKSRFELDRIERRSRRGDNSILSSSWEKNIGPSEPRTKEKYLVRQHSHSQGSSPGPGRREDYTKLSAGRWDEELRCYRPTITQPISPIHSKRLTIQSSEEDGLRAASWDRKLSLEKPSIQISTTKSLEVDLNSQNRIENRQHLYAKAGFSAKASSWDSNLKHDDRKKNNFATSWDDSRREDMRHNKPQKLNIYDKTSSWDSVDIQNKGRKLSKQFSDNWTLNFRSQGERLAKQTPTENVWERHKGNEKMLAECGRAKTFSEMDKDHKKLDTNKKGRRSFSFRRKSKKLETSMSIRLPDSKASSIIGTRLSSQGSFGHSIVNRSYDSNRHDPAMGKLRHSPGGGVRSQPGKSSEESDSAKGPDSSFIPVPPGWTEKYDDAAEQMCYINDQSGAKWYASNDAEGRVYFYPENSEESAWSLPEVQKSQGSTPAALSTELVGVENGDQAEGEEGPSAKENTASAHGGHRAIARNAKTRSLVLLPNKSPDEPSLGRNWPQLNASNMNVIREGSLWRTKFTESGRRCRKNWAHCHAVLTQLHLLLYRDYKIYLQVGAPELSVELTGANIESGEHLSSRKNVFLITTLLGLQVLLQSDNQVVAQQWHHDIEKAIDNLPTNRQEGSPNVKHNRATRSKSVKVKGSTPSPGSIEDLTDDRQTKIRARLKKFFHRRPTREQLVTKGIYKDEPVFGRELAQVCADPDSSGTGLPGIGRVPPFVIRCIHAIESNPENLNTDGLYRVSGNLSQVQTIRLQVDQNNLSAVDQEEDVHVLAGSLKLFFRELKQPLLPWEKFRHLLEDSSPKATKDRLNELSQILKTLPHPNLDTLRFLLKHLLKVVEHKQKNRMHIENLAIVWGPTLLAAEDLLRSTMAIDLMQQNQLLELLLKYFDQLF